MTWLLFILFVMLAVLVFVVWRSARMYSGGGQSRGVILCIPGLGNNAESFDWPAVSPDIPDKIGVHSTRSLKAELVGLGYDVYTFDQPDNPGKDIAEYCDWIEKNVMGGRRPDIILGHSGGAHVANYYAKTRGAKAILLDPTPEFLYDTLRDYKRHIEQPGEARYAKTAKYLWMYTENKGQSAFVVDAPRVVIWSDDDGNEQKRKGVEAISAIEHICVPNATHWVHVTHPDAVLSAISKL